MKRFACLLILLTTCAPHRTTGGPPITSDPLPGGGWWIPVSRKAHEHRVLGCLTPCGVHAVGTVKCAALAQAEKVAIDAYAAHAHLDKDAMCRALIGWRIYVATPGEVSDAGTWWEKDPPLPVYGVTECSDRELYLAVDDWVTGALAHELGHAWGCMLSTPARMGHSGWTKMGYCDAINDASLLKEDCALPKYQ